MKFVYAIFNQENTEFKKELTDANIPSEWPIVYITNFDFWQEHKHMNSLTEEEEQNALHMELTNMSVFVEELQEQTYLVQSKNVKEALENNPNFVNCEEFKQFLSN